MESRSWYCMFLIILFIRWGRIPHRKVTPLVRLCNQLLLWTQPLSSQCRAYRWTTMTFWNLCGCWGLQIHEANALSMTYPPSLQINHLYMRIPQPLGPPVVFHSPHGSLRRKYLITQKKTLLSLSSFSLMLPWLSPSHSNYQNSWWFWFFSLVVHKGSSNFVIWYLTPFPCSISDVHPHSFKVNAPFSL